MKFTVLWTPIAEQRLADLWLGARDRIALVEAVERIDSALAADPLNYGESRDGLVRVGFETPLGIDFEVFRRTTAFLYIPFGGPAIDSTL